MNWIRANTFSWYQFLTMFGLLAPLNLPQTHFLQTSYDLYKFPTGQKQIYHSKIFLQNYNH